MQPATPSGPRPPRARSISIGRARRGTLPDAGRGVSVHVSRPAPGDPRRAQLVIRARLPQPRGRGGLHPQDRGGQIPACAASSPGASSPGSSRPSPPRRGGAASRPAAVGPPRSPCGRRPSRCAQGPRPPRGPASGRAQSQPPSVDGILGSAADLGGLCRSSGQLRSTLRQHALRAAGDTPRPGSAAAGRDQWAEPAAPDPDHRDQFRPVPRRSLSARRLRRRRRHAGRARRTWRTQSAARTARPAASPESAGGTTAGTARTSESTRAAHAAGPSRPAGSAATARTSGTAPAAGPSGAASVLRPGESAAAASARGRGAGARDLGAAAGGLLRPRRRGSQPPRRREAAKGNLN